MLWSSSYVVALPNCRPVILSKLVHASDELCFKEKKYAAHANADLVCLAHVLVRICAASIDLFIQAEAGDLLLLCTSVCLHRRQVVLFQNRQLLVDKQNEIVKTRHVPNRLNFGSTAEFYLALGDTLFPLNLKKKINQHEKNA